MSEQAGQNQAWELMEKAVLASVVEQRRARRWRLFLLFFVLIIYPLFLVTLMSSAGGDLNVKAINAKEQHTAYVKIQGPIMDDTHANANAIVAGMRKAFENEKSKALILAINSPGGSPVQAGYVYDEVLRLKEKYADKKVYAVISDIGASGAYYIAAAADEIYADKASLVGSIGVISASFGYSGVMDKLGIERRVITAGSNKAFLDPYQPLKEGDKVFWESSLAVIHQQFITQVRKGRGDRLSESDEVFSGLVWSGEIALEKGLIDGLGSAGYVARDIVGFEDIVDYTIQPNPLDSFVKQLGISIGEGVSRSVNFSGWAPALF